MRATPGSMGRPRGHLSAGVFPLTNKEAIMA